MCWKVGRNETMMGLMNERISKMCVRDLRFKGEVQCLQTNEEFGRTRGL